ncbi:restriction endonuclease subunit S [Xanthomonas translucens]|uniref:restriction endonuclease subunit S n=1 Tax=Xanthomonas campestris pv. translucens TaxID=343 RepID=UPI0018C8400D|nr:restriction endonuclease subunit S [Xanthomonas translucens]
MTLLRSNNIRFGRLDYDDIQIVPKRLVTETQLMRDGDIAVCMSNGSKSLVGKAAAFFGGGAGKITVGAFCSIFRPEVGCVPEFVRQLFQSGEYRKNLDLALAGSAINNLRNRDLEDFGCDVPPECEQRKIAVILGTIDTAIHETEAMIAKLKAVKQGLLHDLLTRGIDANGELRRPQAEAPHLYKSSSLGWIPCEWTVRRLDACASVAGGVTLGRDLAGPSSIELPYLRVANVQDGYFDLASVKQVRILTDEIERYKLMDGDVLMNEGGDYDKLGRGAVWRSQIEPCLHQNHVFRVRCDSSCLDADFLAFYTASSGGKRFFLLSSKQSTNLASINLTQLKAFPIPCPELDEQQKIVAAVRSSERQAESEELQLSSLRELKSGLMDDLLTGRVRVTPLLTDATA